MTTRYAVLLDSQKGGCGTGCLCVTFAADTLAQCRALDGQAHDGDTEPFAEAEWRIRQTWPIVMDFDGTPDPGVIARLELL